MRSLREDAIRMFDDSYEDTATFDSVYGDAGVPGDDIIETPAVAPVEGGDPVADSVVAAEPLTLTGEQVSALNAAIATIQGILGSSAIEEEPAVDASVETPVATTEEDDAAIIAE